MQNTIELRKGFHGMENQVVPHCVECGCEMQDQRDSLMYECERCINLREE